MLYGKEDILKKLPNQNHEFLKDEYPYTINPGGANHEELVSLIGIYEYLQNLYNHHFQDNGGSILEKIIKINNLILIYEESITNPLLNYLYKSNKFTLFGKSTIKIKTERQQFRLYIKIKVHMS